MALELLSAYQCHPVFLGKELKEEYYKGACCSSGCPEYQQLLP